VQPFRKFSANFKEPEGSSPCSQEPSTVPYPEPGSIQSLPSRSISPTSILIFLIIVPTEQRRIFGPKKDDVTGDWRKLHNEELHNLYSSPNIMRMIKSRRMRWAGHVARMGATRNTYRILVGKPEEKRPLQRSRCRWVDNIKMELREIGWDGKDWIDLAQDRDQWRALVNTVMNLRVQ
jgi:hypothetical protein